MVLRGTGPDGPLAAITGEPVRETRYVDTGLENETLYRYAVRAVRREGAATAYSEPSAPATVTPVDRTAPAPPTNLVAVPSATAVRLAWNPSASPDVTSYVVYRATGEGPFVRIGTTPAITNRVHRSRGDGGDALSLCGDRSRRGARAQRERAVERGRGQHSLTRRRITPRSPTPRRDPAGGGGGARSRRAPA